MDRCVVSPKLCLKALNDSALFCSFFEVLAHIVIFGPATMRLKQSSDPVPVIAVPMRETAEQNR